MSGNDNNPNDVANRLATVERENAELRRIVCGELPTHRGVESVDDRLGALERQVASAAIAQDEPQSIQSPDAGPDFQDLALTDIEWGVPVTDPSDTATATITLRPCDEAGAAYSTDAANDVVVYIRNDRSEVDLSGRDWVATIPIDGETPAVIGTILSFLRFPWDVGSGPAVVGVLVGEAPDHDVFPVILAVTSETSALTGTATTQCGYEYDVTDAWTGDALAGAGTDPAVAAADPITTPHKWVRPTVGYMLAATFGHASYNTDCALVLGWINEVADQEACSGPDEIIDQGSYD